MQRQLCVRTVGQLTIIMMKLSRLFDTLIEQKILKISQKLMKTRRYLYLTTITKDSKDAMLREFQEEIKRLKDQLEAAQRGVIIDEVTGKEISVGENVRKEIVEKIVEREVIKEVEVKVGISEEEMAELNRKAAQEKELLMKQAQQDMKALIDQNSRTAQEREELQAAFAKEAEAKKALEEQKHSLASKLKASMFLC